MIFLQLLFLPIIFLWTTYFQSSGQLGQTPWWLWLAILIILLGFLIVGVFVREDSGHRYPEIQKSASGKTGNQISTGTELESDVSGGTIVAED